MSDEKKPGFNINTQGIKEFFVNFLIPIVALGVSAVLIFLFMMPAFKNLPLLKADVAAKSALETQLTAKVDSLSKLVNFRKVVDENSMLVSNVLVSEALVPQLLTQIDLIAQESGLAVDKLSYSFSDPAKTNAPVSTEGTGTAPVAPYSTVIVNLGAVGSYEQLRVFLETLENSARLVNVNSYRFTMSDDKDASKLEMTIILNSPYLFVESNAVTDDPVTLDISSQNFVKVVNRIKELKLYQVSVTKDFGPESSQSTSSL